MAPNSISRSIQLVQPSTTMTVEDFFKEQNIFITGGTGFVGKVLIEKLLWSCKSIGNLYLLIRPNKGCSVDKRIEDIIKLPLFDRLRKRDSSVFKKIIPIFGDVAKPNLDISDADRKLLEDSISIVFHAASSVRFDDPLKKAVLINLRGTKYVMDIVKNMKNLKVMLYVSTTYSNTDKREVEEKVYLSKFSWRDMIKLVETCDDNTLNILTKKILDKQPNTYTYTKFLTENLIYEYSKDLPCAIFRPSIVIYTLKDPVPGWTDNLNGITGLATGVLTGVLHVIYGDESILGDYIPCDFVINGIVVAAWYRGNSTTKECIVINGANGGKKYIALTTLTNKSDDIIRSNPPNTLLWYPFFMMTKNRYVYILVTLFTQIIPALILDMAQYFTESKFGMMRLYRKVFSANEALTYFLMNSWKFDTTNHDSISRFLTPADAKTYNYDMNTVDENDALNIGLHGIKNYILKESGEVTQKAARIKFRRMYWLHQMVKAVFTFLFFLTGWCILSKLTNYLKPVVNNLNQ